MSNNSSIQPTLQEYLTNQYLFREKSFGTLELDEPYINYWKETITKNTNGVIETLISNYSNFKFLNHLTFETSKLANSTLEIYDSFAGKVLVFNIPNPEGFKYIISHLYFKGNESQFPSSMGASFISNIPNTVRLSKLNSNLSESNTSNSRNTFSEREFKDKLILLSHKPYSNISHKDIGVSKKMWNIISYKIRLEHECTHLLTKKIYQYAGNNVHDELIADYVGISKANGVFDKSWMLQFLGLEDYPNYRIGARLQNYIPENFDNYEFKELMDVVYKAINALGHFDKKLGKFQDNTDLIRRVITLCETGIINMSKPTGTENLLDNYLDSIFK